MPLAPEDDELLKIWDCEKCVDAVKDFILLWELLCDLCVDFFLLRLIPSPNIFLNIFYIGSLFKVFIM